MNLKVSNYNAIKIKPFSLKRKDKIGSGCNGKIYRFGDNEVIKKWKINSFPLMNDGVVDQLDKMSKLNINWAVFPNRLALFGRRIKGYTMDYIDGSKMSYCGDFDYSFFLSKFNEYKNGCLEEMNSRNIIMSDVKPANIMWDNVNSVFRSIDVDDWYESNCPDHYISNRNFRLINNAFAYYFIYYINYNLQKDALKLDDSSDFIDFYETVRYELSKQTDDELITMNDVRRHTYLYGKKK